MRCASILIILGFVGCSRDDFGQKSIHDLIEEGHLSKRPTSTEIVALKYAPLRACTKSSDCTVLSGLCDEPVALAVKYRDVFNEATRWADKPSICQPVGEEVTSASCSGEICLLSK